MEEIASFQIGALNRLQAEDRLNSDAYMQLMSQLKQLNSTYADIEKNKLKLDPLFKEIKFKFIAYKKDAENPMQFYDQNYVSKVNEKLLGDIQRALDFINAIL